jgi:hypothetical protein
MFASRDFGDFTNNTFSWTADLAPGTEYVLSAENQDGDEAWSKSVSRILDYLLPMLTVKTL